MKAVQLLTPENLSASAWPSSPKGDWTLECLLSVCIYTCISLCNSPTDVTLVVNQDVLGIVELKNLVRKYIPDITINSLVYLYLTEVCFWEIFLKKIVLCPHPSASAIGWSEEELDEVTCLYIDVHECICVPFVHQLTPCRDCRCFDLDGKGEAPGHWVTQESGLRGKVQLYRGAWGASWRR